jgi:hypothetical protein
VTLLAALRVCPRQRWIIAVLSECGGGEVAGPVPCWALSASQPVPVFTVAMAEGAVSDSGSGMGAAGCCQGWSEGVTVPGSTSLTCGNVV